MAIRSRTLNAIVLGGLTAMWAAFQTFDSTPPPVLDQILIAAFGAWFAHEAVGGKTKSKTDTEEDVDE